ncbi:19096_t:CDS:1, partial [Racocetra fulgida]
MAQTIFNHLNNSQKTATKHINFQQSNNKQPSLSGETLNVYDNPNSGLLNGELDLAPFPNLRKITFQQNVRFNILESIDLSKNEKLSRIVISGQNDNFFENNSFTLLIKEIQLSRIILACEIKDYRGTQWVWIKTTNYLRDQAIIPYFLVEDRKIEQLEAEVA